MYKMYRVIELIVFISLLTFIGQKIYYSHRIKSKNTEVKKYIKQIDGIPQKTFKVEEMSPLMRKIFNLYERNKTNISAGSLGIPFYKNYEKYAQELQNQAESGNYVALYVIKNHFNNLELAAKLGHSVAQAEYAYQIAKINKEKALNYLKLSMDQGQALGFIYYLKDKYFEDSDLCKYAHIGYQLHGIDIFPKRNNKYLYVLQVKCKIFNVGEDINESDILTKIYNSEDTEEYQFARAVIFHIEQKDYDTGYKILMELKNAKSKKVRANVYRCLSSQKFQKYLNKKEQEDYRNISYELGIYNINIDSQAILTNMYLGNNCNIL